MLARVALGVTRSCSFLGIYVVIYQGTFPWLGRLKAKLTSSSFLPSNSEFGKVDQEWVLESDHEEERDILVTWVLDMSQSSR